MGTRTARDDNKIRWALIADKLQNEREYRLDWAKWKAKIQSPADMLSVLHSKNSQALVSDVDYRNYLHQWTCMPDQNDVIQAKKAYELQSDVSGLHLGMNSSQFAMNPREFMTLNPFVIILQLHNTKNLILVKPYSMVSKSPNPIRT